VHYTVFETGARLVIAKGKWNCPRDAQEGVMRDAWLVLPDDMILSLGVGGLRAGEWDLVDESVLPLDLKARIDTAFYLATKSPRRAWQK
jgi:hypothetical protein